MTTFSKIEERTSKHAQPLLTFEKTLPTRLLAPKSKRHRPPNLESQTPNMITFSKIEVTLLPESQEPDPHHDCFLKNRRCIVLRINRRDARFLKSWAAQRPRGPISEIEEAPTFLALSAPVTRTLSFAEIMGILSKTSREHRPLFQSALTELKHVKLAAPTTVL
ncbi:hypothetical protein ACFX13_016263 [Malus domestica]